MILGNYPFVFQLYIFSLYCDVRFFLLFFHPFSIFFVPSDLTGSVGTSNVRADINMAVGTGKKDFSYVIFLLDLLGGVGTGVRRVVLDAEAVRYASFVCVFVYVCVRVCECECL